MPKKGQSNGFIIKCENCGKEVYKTRSQYYKREHHFCSNKCQSELKRKETFEYRSCESCGRSFYVSKKSTQRFCSTKCWDKKQATITGKDNPRYKRTISNCDVCGKVIYLKDWQLKKFPRHFCSNKCRRFWYATDFSQSEEWREESRIRSTRILSDSKVNTYTKPQIIVNDILEKLNIAYENEANYKYFSIDNKLTDYNLLIEVMGDFWHVNPNRYSLDNITDVQRKRIPRDKAKHTYIKNNYGIEILYLWESDLYNSEELCTLLIEKYIENKGILEDYHSFNYEIVNGELKLKENRILAYQDRHIDRRANA